MGLPGELDEIKKAWKDAPPILKLWLILSAFLSFASIASISQTVFEWKGFLLNAVLFYREHVSEPLAATLQQWFHIVLPSSFFDAAALFAVCGMALVRSFWFDAHQTRTREDYVLAAVVTVIFVVGMSYQTIRVARAPASFSPNWYVIIGGYLFLVALSLFRGQRALAPYELLWFAYLVLPPAVLAIIAAISEGLHRVA